MGGPAVYVDGYGWVNNKDALIRLKEQEAAAEAADASGAAQKPNWIDGTSSPGTQTVNVRAPLTPSPGAILVKDQDIEPSGPVTGGRNRAVVDRTTGRIRGEDEDERRRTGAFLLR